MKFTVTTEFDALPDLGTALSGFPLEAANLIGEKIVDSMHEPKSGNTYESRKTGKSHRASAEGESPGIDSETLVSSFQAVEIDDFAADLYSEVEYGAILEDKRNRPFSDSATEKALPEIEDDLLERIENAWA